MHECSVCTQSTHAPLSGVVGRLGNKSPASWVTEMTELNEVRTSWGRPAWRMPAGGRFGVGSGAEGVSGGRTRLGQQGSRMSRMWRESGERKVQGGVDWHRRTRLLGMLPSHGPGCSPMRQSWADGTSACIALGPKLRECITLRERRGQAGGRTIWAVRMTEGWACLPSCADRAAPDTQPCTALIPKPSQRDLHPFSSV